MTVTETDSKPESTGIMSRVTSVEQNIDYLKLCLYGSPGVGKTKFACESPGTLLIDTEHGSRTLKNHPELSGVRILKVKAVDDLSKVFWELKDGAFPEYKTIVIDTLSELQKRALDEQLKLAARVDPKRDPFVPEGKDYQRNTEQIRKLVMSFRDLDRNIIFTAHELEEKDDDGTFKVRPALTPKVNQTLYGLMDCMAYLTLQVDKEGNATRNLQTVPSRRVMAKSRLAIPAIINNPSLQYLLNANQGKMPKATGEGKK